MFDGADRFSRPAANDAGLPTSLEKAADLLIASIAARARRQHADLAGRVAYFNTETERHQKRFWDPGSAVRRAPGHNIGGVSP